MSSQTTQPPVPESGPAHELLSAALRYTRDAEVFWAREDAVTAGIVGNREPSQTHAAEAVGLRVIHGGHIGHAVHHGSIQRVENAALLGQATRNTAQGPPAPPTFWKERATGLPIPTWDDDVASLDEKDLRRMARQAAARLRDMLGKDVPTQVAVRRLIRRTVLLTRAAERLVERTILSFQAQVGPLPDGGSRFTESWISGRIPDDPMASLGNIIWRASLGTSIATCPSSPNRAVFGPRAVGVLLHWLANTLTGTRLLDGCSRWNSGLVDNAQIVDERITLFDNPLRPWAPTSAPYDAEGLPRDRHALVERGVLRTLLLDLSTAWQLGLEPRGTASRGFDTPPTPAPSFLELVNGPEGFEDLLSGCEGGIYVDTLDEGAEPAADGQFEAMAGNAFRIRNGRPSGWLPGVVITANLHELLNEQVLAIGGDRLGGPNVCCGSIAFRDVEFHGPSSTPEETTAGPRS